MSVQFVPAKLAISDRLLVADPNVLLVQSATISLRALIKDAKIHVPARVEVSKDSARRNALLLLLEVADIQMEKIVFRVTVGARCQVVNHNPICSCPNNYVGDPFEQCVPMSKFFVIFAGNVPLIFKKIQILRLSSPRSSKPLPTKPMRTKL